jgi:hypothetical protein
MADAQLKVLLQKAKSKPCNFVVAVDGTRKVALILSNKAISGKQKQAAKDRAGGAKTHIGVVEGGSGRGLIFKVADEMPGSADVIVKKYITQETGLHISVEFRKA